MNSELSRQLPPTYRIARYIECPIRYQETSNLEQTKARAASVQENLLIYKPYCVRFASRSTLFDPTLPTAAVPLSAEKFLSMKTGPSRFIKLSSARKTEITKNLAKCSVNMTKLISDKPWTAIIASGLPLTAVGFSGQVDIVATSKFGTYLVMLMFDDPSNHYLHHSELELHTWAFEKIVNNYDIKQFWINFPMLYYPLHGVEVVLPRTRESSIEPLLDAFREKKIWHNRSFCDKCEITVCNVQTNMRRRTE